MFEMKLETQVCSLKLAKKLKKLGVKQDSLFYWDNNPLTLLAKGLKQGKFGIIDKVCVNFHNENYSAFTVAELGELLKQDAYSIFTHKEGKWLCECIYDMGVDKGDGVITMKAKTEADARAKMSIYLLENNLIKGDKNE